VLPTAALAQLAHGGGEAQAAQGQRGNSYSDSTVQKKSAL